MSFNLFSILKRPVRFDYIGRYNRIGGRFRILDVGCGNHSASITKAYYPTAEYHGLDIDRSYNNSRSDEMAMDRFYPINLDEPDMDQIPDSYYDIIIVSHVVEHLQDGLGVLGGLVPKLVRGGIIYVETPHPRSLNLPSMKGSLNFHDDESHVRIYPASDISARLADSGCDILCTTTRRSLKRIILTPVHCFNSLIRDGYVSGSAFWDILGFASVVVARRGFR